jgi:hypothetical protein
MLIPFFNIYPAFTEIPVDTPDDIQEMVMMFDVYSVFILPQVLSINVNVFGTELVSLLVVMEYVCDCNQIFTSVEVVVHTLLLDNNVT